MYDKGKRNDEILYFLCFFPLSRGRNQCEANGEWIHCCVSESSLCDPHCGHSTTRSDQKYKFIIECSVNNAITFWSCQSQCHTCLVSFHVKKNKVNVFITKALKCVSCYKQTNKCKFLTTASYWRTFLLFLLWWNECTMKFRACVFWQ